MLFCSTLNVLTIKQLFGDKHIYLSVTFQNLKIWYGVQKTMKSSQSWWHLSLFLLAAFSLQVALARLTAIARNVLVKNLTCHAHLPVHAKTKACAWTLLLKEQTVFYNNLNIFMAAILDFLQYVVTLQRNQITQNIWILELS